MSILPYLPFLLSIWLIWETESRFERIKNSLPSELLSDAGKEDQAVNALIWRLTLEEFLVSLHIAFITSLSILLINAKTEYAGVTALMYIFSISFFTNLNGAWKNKNSFDAVKIYNREIRRESVMRLIDSAIVLVVATLTLVFAQ